MLSHGSRRTGRRNGDSCKDEKRAKNMVINSKDENLSWAISKDPKFETNSDDQKTETSKQNYFDKILPSPTDGRGQG